MIKTPLDKQKDIHMPIYAYSCNSCNSQADYLVKFDDPIPPCKECGTVDQSKLLSTGTAMCLMGHGWTKNGMSSKKVEKR